MAHLRGSRFPRRSVRRETGWEIGPSDVDGSASSSLAKVWSSFVIPVSPGLTVVRIRGGIKFQLATADAIGSGFFGAVGIGIVEEAAITAGVASVPTPLTEEASENWLWFSYFDIRAITATIADGVNAASASMWLPIDTKAMRKLPAGKALYGAWEVVESTNASMEVQAQCRVLVKFP